MKQNNKQSKWLWLIVGLMLLPLGVKAQGAKLDCDFCQMAHHGQQGVRRSFYEAVKPRFTLWPTPDWLWRNDSGKGDGSGPFKTCDTRIWAAELGVEQYFVAKDGLIKLTF